MVDVLICEECGKLAASLEPSFCDDGAMIALCLECAIDHFANREEPQGHEVKAGKP